MLLSTRRRALVAGALALLFVIPLPVLSETKIAEPLSMQVAKRGDAIRPGLGELQQQLLGGGARRRVEALRDAVPVGPLFVVSADLAERLACHHAGVEQQAINAPALELAREPAVDEVLQPGAFGHVVHGAVGKVLDREDRTEDRLEPNLLPLVRRDVHLEELVVARLLDVDQVGDVDDATDPTQVLADAEVGLDDRRHRFHR